MAEGTPKHIKETAAWAINRISQRMQQEPVPLDKGDSHGFGYKAQDPENLHDQRYAALFPSERVVRIGAPGLEVKIKNATARPSQDGIEVRAGDGSIRALFLRDGHIAVEVFPIPSLAVSEATLNDETSWEDKVHEAVFDSDPGASSGQIQASGDESWDIRRARYESGIAASRGFDFEAARAELAAMSPDLATYLEVDRLYGDDQIPRTGTVPEQVTPETARDAVKENNRVKNLRGRVATQPNVDPTPTGKPRVQFLLAEHLDHEGEDQTVFHRVYTLNKQAESLQRRGISKGQRVGIDGYKQQQKFRKKDGTEEEREVIYANVVRTLGRGERMQAAEATDKEPE